MTVTNLVVASRNGTRLMFVVGVLDVALRFGSWLQGNGWEVEVWDSTSIPYRHPTPHEDSMIQALTHEYEAWCVQRGRDA